ncbi:MAG: hypothetical protein JSV33_02790 [bacterium]|nr:MAG: hypothetical protein JSV33_02790 [bacterium]
MHRLIVIIAIIAWLSLLVCTGCSEDVYLGEKKENQQPTVRLMFGPSEEDTRIYYQVHFYWMGHDVDGAVEYYEYVIAEGDPIGFNTEDTTGPDKWDKIFRTDTTFMVHADEYDSLVIMDYRWYSLYSKTYTFFIRAVDDRGMRSEPAYQSFTARTLAPSAILEFPRNPHPGHIQSLNLIVLFKWYGKDPIDSPWNYQDVDSIRYLLYTDAFGLDTLNNHPERVEDLWSPWIWYQHPDDSGKETIIGDDEILESDQLYTFAVQAKDEAGAVSSIFDEKVNVRRFIPQQHSGPVLDVAAPYLGNFRFIGTDFPLGRIKTMIGFPLKFSWRASASHYGGIISSYRYGWDVEDLSNPLDWDVLASPFHTAAPTKKYFFGIHTLYIEAVDNYGTATLGQIEVSIIPFAMNRNLLWIDDFHSGEFQQDDYAMPTESEHDQFWINICKRAEEFDPFTDVFDCSESNSPPDMEHVFKYKNIIWTYASDARTNVWDDIVLFTREEVIGGTPRSVFNYLAAYMKSGGHLWTLGKSDRSGGLAAVLYALAQKFPVNVRCEVFMNAVGCEDTVGVHCMAYRDYCVHVLDKAQGFHRDGLDALVDRSVDMDALSYGYKDSFDPVTSEHQNLPEKLNLWETVTQQGKYFYPKDRGFHYIEVYDPEYWMQLQGITSQSCFHPMYRMRSRNTRSCLNDATIAFWTTKYADIVAEAPDCVAAASVHFGLPLWFFDREEVNAIADVIFTEWHIKAD